MLVVQVVNSFHNFLQSGYIKKELKPKWVIQNKFPLRQ